MCRSVYVAAVADDGMLLLQLPVWGDLRLGFNQSAIQQDKGTHRQGLQPIPRLICPQRDRRYDRPPALTSIKQHDARKLQGRSLQSAAGAAVWSDAISIQAARYARGRLSIDSGDERADHSQCVNMFECSSEGKDAPGRSIGPSKETDSSSFRRCRIQARTGAVEARSINRCCGTE